MVNMVAVACRGQGLHMAACLSFLYGLTLTHRGHRGSGVGLDGDDSLSRY